MGFFENKLFKMKQTIGFFMAAITGGVVASSAFYFSQANKLEQERAIAELKQTQLNEATNHRVNYAPSTAPINFSDAAEQTVNSVVHVKTTFELDGGYYSFDPIRHFFFGDGIYQKQPRIGAGAGSGVILSEDGYIITNNHVIDGAATIMVTMNDKKSYEAEIIGQDPSSDLALLKIDGSGFPKIEMGNSDQVRLGEWVLAVGNPFNLESTVTAGIVSAKGRDINILANGPNGSNAIESFIQTDAAVNPGNSGGALVNTRGELVGINAAIKSNTGSYTGYSFAIPVNIVSKVVSDLLEFGAVQRGYLGVRIQDVTSELIEETEVKADFGVYVAQVLDMGAAKEAGLKSGDVIQKIGNQSIKGVTELQEQVSKYRPGDKVLVTINRDNEIVEIPVTLRNQFGEESLTPKSEMDLHTRLNAQFEDVDSKLQKELDIQGGVQIKDMGPGKLRNAGISPEFIILKVDQQNVKNKEDLIKKLENKEGGILIEGIYPNGKKAYYGFGL